MTKRRELVQLFIDSAQQYDDRDEGITWYYIQRQPYTYVCVTLHLDAGAWKGHGFAKVMHPDNWSKIKGVELAFTKACGDSADTAIADYDAEEIREYLDA